MSDTPTTTSPRTTYLCINGHHENVHGEAIDPGAFDDDDPRAHYECATEGCHAEAEEVIDSLDAWNHHQQTKDLEAHLERRLATVNESIRREARRLAEKMTDLADRLEDHPRATGMANSLGEVQGAGPDIDRLCATRQEILDLLAGFEHQRAGTLPASGRRSVGGYEMERAGR